MLAPCSHPNGPTMVAMEKNHPLCQTRSLTLQTPLGSWNKHYDTNNDWMWHICNTTYNLYHHSPQGWVTYWLDMLQCTYVWYTYHTTHPTAPIPITPATPMIQTDYIWNQTTDNSHPHTHWTPQTHLTQLIQMLTTLTKHLEQPLWYQISPHANLYTLHEFLLGQGQSIWLISNTSVNHWNMEHAHGSCTPKPNFGLEKELHQDPPLNCTQDLLKPTASTLPSASCTTTSHSSWQHWPDAMQCMYAVTTKASLSGLNNQQTFQTTPMTC